ncbi:MAG: acyltransferase [Lachnospiraceae bacterium]|nr:acyltransferase [Lachnospiraceae bacterium]
MKEKLLRIDSPDSVDSDENNIIYKDRLLNWQILSKNRNLLFGLAISWVILLHMTNFPVIDKWKGFRENSLMMSVYRLIDLGGVGVDIFLFLSGIGLYYSFSRCPNLQVFYEKRLKRVLIPYLIVGTIYWIIKDILYGEGVVRFFRDLFWVTYYSEGASTYWYINFILLMYLLFPLFYYLLENKYRNVNLILLLVFSLGMIFVMYTKTPELYLKIEKSVTRIPIFILGCYWGKIVKSGKPMNRRWIIYSLIIPWMGGFFQYAGKHGGIPWKITSRLWYGMLAIAVCIMVSLFFMVIDLGKINWFLNMAGTLSLELYLFHIALQRLLRLLSPDYKTWSMRKNCILYFLLVVVLSFILANLYHYISEKIAKRMSRR